MFINPVSTHSGIISFDIVKFSAINLPCDSVHEYSGSFYSPYYPDNYLANQTCRALHRIPEPYNGTYILRIRGEDFELEDSVDCSHDSLTFYDGDSENSTALGRYCGTNFPAFIIGGSAITAVFETNADVSAKGYKYYVNWITEGMKLI